MAIQTATEQPYRNMPTGAKAAEGFGKGYFSYVPNEAWRPSVNLYENDPAYLVCVDLAGVSKQQIDVVVEDQTLRIHGTRAVPTPEAIPEMQKQRIRIHLMEIDHGNFTRDVELPADVEKDHISAQHRNGMLWIELPKKK
jgi:HSP20 family protein